jgi:nicotinamide mononucleotide adenylyltransferase
MKTNKKFGLIIGRFQPPCLHHLEFIKEVINSGIQELLVGVGDSGIIDEKNFLTAQQVKDLLIPNLDKLNFPYQIQIIPDIHNPPKYADHVKTFFPQINESNTCLFTDNSYTSDCFINYGHHFEHLIPTILPSRATNIRQMISDHDLNWQKLVPQNTLEFIKNKYYLSQI